MSILNIKQLSASLKSNQILSDLNLTAKAGLNIIIGPNGSGKTTLLRVIAGLCPATSGQVLWGKDDLLPLSSQVRAKAISYLAQNPQIHWPLLVKNIVALGLAKTNKHPQRSIEAAMKACNILQFCERSIAELSGGERARVLLARALAVQADLLIVDEPTSALDPAQQLAMMQTLATEAKTGKTILIVMHDLPLATRFADQLLIMDRGQITANGKPKQVICSLSCQKAFNLKFNADGHLLV